MDDNKPVRLYDPKPKDKRDPKRLARYTVKMLLHQFGLTFDSAECRDLLGKLARERPHQFLDMYIKLLGRIDITEQTKEVKDARGLLNAMQTGRLAEELAQVVRSAKQNMNNNNGHYNIGNTEPLETEYTDITHDHGHDDNNEQLHE